jgi:hypothetical protein
LSDRLLEPLQVLLDLGVDGLGDPLPVLVVERADLGRDREARGHGQADPGHLGQVGALAAEDVLHLHIAFGGAGPEEINILLSHYDLLTYGISEEIYTDSGANSNGLETIPPAKPFSVSVV